MKARLSGIILHEYTRIMGNWLTTECPEIVKLARALLPSLAQSRVFIQPDVRGAAPHNSEPMLKAHDTAWHKLAAALSKDSFRRIHMLVHHIGCRIGASAELPPTLRVDSHNTCTEVQLLLPCCEDPRIATPAQVQGLPQLLLRQSSSHPSLPLPSPPSEVHPGAGSSKKDFKSSQLSCCVTMSFQTVLLQEINFDEAHEVPPRPHPQSTALLSVAGPPGSTKTFRQLIAWKTVLAHCQHFGHRLYSNKHAGHIIPYHTIAYCIIPYHTIEHVMLHTRLYYTRPYYTIPYYTLLNSTTLYYTLLYSTMLHHAVLYYTILYYTILYYTILYYTILYYTILYYTIPYYTI